MGTVLGLHGPAKAGKDTIADYLLLLPEWHAKLSFADNLKKMCQAVFFLSDDDVQTQKGKERLFPEPKIFTQRNLGSVLYWMSNTHAQYPVHKGSKAKVASLVGTELYTPRHVLQFVGTEVCRELINTYHLDVLEKFIAANPDKNFIITDIRFPNEGDLVLDTFAGNVIKVVRDSPLHENIDRAHASEVAMSEWGRFTDTIDNRKHGLSFLFSEVNTLMERKNLCQETTTPLSKSPKVSSSPTEETAAPSEPGTIKTTLPTGAVLE